jgi:hypothetical protein
MTRDLLARYPQLQTLRPEHCAELGELFVKMSPEYFLSRFGPNYLADAFWKRFCDTPGCFGFVWIHEGRVAGFAGATTCRREFLGKVLRRSAGRFLAALPGAVVRTPVVITEGLDLLRRLGREKEGPGPEAELLILGVEPRACVPAGGVSPAVILMVAAGWGVAERGLDSFRLYCTVSNRIACRFYRSLGFDELHRFVMFGVDKICFVRSTRFSAELVAGTSTAREGNA